MNKVDATGFEPQTMEDAKEIIASLRNTVDEQQDYIDVLEDQIKSGDASSRRERLVAAIVPSMIDHFRGDLSVDGGGYARVLITTQTLKLADRLIMEMDEKG
jgi:hypothetical protein